MPAANGRFADDELDTLLCMACYRPGDLLFLWPQKEYAQVIRRQQVRAFKDARAGFPPNPRYHGFLTCCVGPQHSSAQAVLAWGNSAQRMIVSHAVDTLPYDIRYFFEANRAYLVEHVDDPIDLIDKHPSERLNHFIELDKYGKWPYAALPRSYQAALAKYGKSKIDATGLLPWAIGLYSQKLTEDMKAGRWARSEERCGVSGELCG